MTKQKDSEQQDNLSKLKNLIKEIDIGMLTTLESDGVLRSRPMSTNGDFDEEGNLWFFTYGESHKVTEAQQNPQVNVSFVGKHHEYVSISGTAKLVRDKNKIKELWRPQFKAWFPQGIDTPDIALLKVVGHKAEFWDSPGGLAAHIISLATALVTGKTYAGGENIKINLDT